MEFDNEFVKGLYAILIYILVVLGIFIGSNFIIHVIS
jgi:hypothetical protein